MMRLILLFVMGALLSHADTVTLHTRRQNLVRLTLDTGVADIEWLSSTAFRFSRDWRADAPAANPFSLERVEFELLDKPDALSLSTKSIRVRIAKAGLLLSVEDSEGKALMTESAAVQRTESGMALQRRLPQGEYFFGLGVRPSGPLSLRGVSIESDHPFLLSTLGYGQYFRGAETYLFDLGSKSADECLISAPRATTLEYFFYYGPAIKDIFEEHLNLADTIDRRLPADYRVVRKMPRDAFALPRGDLADTVRALINSSLSGIRVPALDLLRVEAPAPRLFALAATVPVVVRSGTAPRGSLPVIRERLIPYLQTYEQEARDRAFPMIRALPMQFPKDPKGWEIDDQFMLGDELLVAPAITGEPRRPVYLPMGVWTDLRNNTTHNGRQTIDIEVAEGDLPLFVKNGSILPLAPERSGDPMTLHYFPKLAAEFFLYETDLGEISQFHAAPAGDFMRVEVESRHSRIYEWVIHHIPQPAGVAEGTKDYTRVRSAEMMKPGTWRVDDRSRNVHIRMEGPAGEDRIVNIRF